MHISDKTRSIIEEHNRIVAPVQMLSELPFAVEGAHGIYLVDADGRDVVDFISGACTMNLGYDPIPHGTFAQFPFPYATSALPVRYARKLASKFPYGDCLVSYGICGSDGIDASIKYSRAFTRRSGVLSFRGNYHGKTMGSMAITGDGGRAAIGPLMPGATLLPFCSEQASASEVAAVLGEAERLAPSLACAVFECVQGDSGFLPMHRELMHGLYEPSRKYGFLMVSDESQLAFYRTGPFFSCQNFPDIECDLIVMGKFAGGGIPLSAVLGRPGIMRSLKPLEHDFTFAGNQEACARGIAAFDRCEELSRKGRLLDLAQLMLEAFATLKAKHGASLARVTGCGTAYGLWVRDPKGEDDKKACFKVVFRCFENGLFTQRLGSSFLRCEPEYVITDEELSRCFGIISAALTDLEQGRIGDECMEYYVP
ncbi:MAG: aspartate aminotransferase family protein [Succinivibrio sp.]